MPAKGPAGPRSSAPDALDPGFGAPVCDLLDAQAPLEWTIRRATLQECRLSEHGEAFFDRGAGSWKHSRCSWYLLRIGPCAGPPASPSSSIYEENPPRFERSPSAPLVPLGPRRYRNGSPPLRWRLSIRGYRAFSGRSVLGRGSRHGCGSERLDGEHGGQHRRRRGQRGEHGHDRGRTRRRHPSRVRGRRWWSVRSRQRRGRRPRALR
jgi:hypothetical protein